MLSAVKPVHCQTPVPELAIRALVRTVLPWRAWLDQQFWLPMASRPVQQHGTHKLRAIIVSQICRISAFFCNGLQHFAKPLYLGSSLHAHHFFEVISFMTSISRSGTAKILFNRLRIPLKLNAPFITGDAISTLRPNFIPFGEYAKK
jgi:hypothetical protein